ncbi:MAG: hypothetical protein AAF696_03080 [Bacteroidota bacterium]
MSIDIAPILKLSRAERLLIIQAIAESLKVEEEQTWEPSKEQKERLDAISARIHAGERGKSWSEVMNQIKSTNGI